MGAQPQFLQSTDQHLREEEETTDDAMPDLVAVDVDARWTAALAAMDMEIGEAEWNSEDERMIELAEVGAFEAAEVENSRQTVPAAADFWAWARSRPSPRL